MLLTYVYKCSHRCAVGHVGGDGGHKRNPMLFAFSDLHKAWNTGRWLLPVQKSLWLRRRPDSWLMHNLERIPFSQRIHREQPLPEYAWGLQQFDKAFDRNAPQIRSISVGSHNTPVPRWNVESRKSAVDCCCTFFAYLRISQYYPAAPLLHLPLLTQPTCCSFPVADDPADEFLNQISHLYFI